MDELNRNTSVVTVWKEGKEEGVTECETWLELQSGSVVGATVNSPYTENSEVMKKFLFTNFARTVLSNRIAKLLIKSAYNLMCLVIWSVNRIKKLHSLWNI